VGPHWAAATECTGNLHPAAVWSTRLVDRVYLERVSCILSWIPAARPHALTFNAHGRKPCIYACNPHPIIQARCVYGRPRHRRPRHRLHPHYHFKVMCPSDCTLHLSAVLLAAEDASSTQPASNLTASHRADCSSKLQQGSAAATGAVHRCHRILWLPGTHSCVVHRAQSSACDAGRPPPAAAGHLDTSKHHAGPQPCQQNSQLGTPDAGSNGRQVGQRHLCPHDRVTAGAARMQGVAMNLALGARLDGGQGRLATTEERAQFWPRST
jgi:hypothetical protein